MTKSFAIVKRNFPASSGKETFREGDRFRARTRADLGNSRQLNSAKNPHGPAANVDDLDRPLRIGVAIGLFVGAIKVSDELHACSDAKLIGLSDIADVEPMFESLLSLLEPF